jgi:hypothetical protein
MTDHSTPMTDAGVFTSWLRRMLYSLATDSDTHTPCGDCTGCCRSSNFIHIHPDEKAALRAIPKTLTFPAPGAPKGTRLLGYDAEGRCPLLSDLGCTIYDARPRTCRIYDCRAFAAAGLIPGTATDHPVGRKVGTWRFSYPTSHDKKCHQAVVAAARFLEEKADLFPGRKPPADPAQRTILALKVHRVFLERQSDPDRVASIVEASSRFEAKREALILRNEISPRRFR